MYKQQETVTYNYSETDFHLQNQLNYLTSKSHLLICILYVSFSICSHYFTGCQMSLLQIRGMYSVVTTLATTHKCTMSLALLMG